MILRPLNLPAPAAEFQPAWEAVERTQTQPSESCWMITQPSHAALAGQLAAHLNPPQFPVAGEVLVQAIALHDAGWGIPDAQAIVQSRALQQHRPQSFLSKSVPQYLEAWAKSIEAGESVSPAGGYIVSRHFWRLAEHRVHHEEIKAGTPKMEAFLKHEAGRQKKLAARQSLTLQQLEELTDLLQFCDLLSLYLCCGTRQNVVFPDYFGVRLRITHQDEVYKFDPPLMQSGTTFTVAALRYPATQEESSREIQVTIV